MKGRAVFDAFSQGGPSAAARRRNRPARIKILILPLNFNPAAASEGGRNLSKIFILKAFLG